MNSAHNHQEKVYDKVGRRVAGENVSKDILAGTTRRESFTISRLRWSTNTSWRTRATLVLVGLRERCLIHLMISQMPFSEASPKFLIHLSVSAFLVLIFQLRFFIATG